MDEALASFTSLSSWTRGQPNTADRKPRQQLTPNPIAARTTARPVLLVLDHDPAVPQTVDRLAAQLGFDLIACTSATAALHLLQTMPASLALVDSGMGNGKPLDVLEQIHAAAPGCEVVIMGSDEDGISAVEAIRRGARDYVAKPLDPERLRRVLNHLCEEAGRRAHIFALEAQLAEQTEFRGMIGRSAAMQDLFSLIQRLATHTRQILITGETGTGKGLVARAFHDASPRRHQALVSRDDARGSYSAALYIDRGDSFEVPSGGTLVVDDVADLSLAQQARLLEKLIQLDADGSAEEAIIAVTNRDLRTEVANGRFDEKLFERLTAVHVALPPLRDRREDIPYLTAAFIRESGHKLLKSFDGVTPYAERLLLNARWDGNVRELRHVIERGCMLADGRLISERELFNASATSAEAEAASSSAATVGILGTPIALQPRRIPGVPTVHLDQIEREHIVDTLQRVSGNRMAAAKALGISRRALYRRLERHRITLPVAKHGGGRGSDLRRQPSR